MKPWLEPMNESVADLLAAGVQVVERGWLSSNLVIVAGDDACAAIDSGYATHAEQTVALVHAVLQDRRLDALVNTHLHSDHCGGNAALQAAYPDVQTWIPQGDADAVSRWDPVALTYEPTGQLCPRFRFERTLQHESTLRLGELDWEVHAAPGHDPHSVILFEPASRTLLSADALWENGFGVVFPELEGAHAFSDVAATLDWIEALAPSVVVPGHGRPFTDVGGALDRARSRLAAYEAQPRRHASHAAKVLLKFKLLELQRCPLDALLDWAERTPYFRAVHARWFGDEAPRSWALRLFGELETSGAAARRDGFAVDA